MMTKNNAVLINAWRLDIGILEGEKNTTASADDGID
jgi:hypothetical protein